MVMASCFMFTQRNNKAESRALEAAKCQITNATVQTTVDGRRGPALEEESIVVGASKEGSSRRLME